MRKNLKEKTEENLQLQSLAKRLDRIETLLEKKISGEAVPKYRRSLLNTDEAAYYLGISRREIYRLTAHGKIPYTTVGARRRYRIEDLNKYLDSNFISERESII